MTNKKIKAETYVNYNNRDSKDLKKLVSELKEVTEEKDFCGHENCWLESHPCFEKYFRDTDNLDPYGEPEIYEMYFCFFHMEDIKQLTCPTDMLNRVLENYFNKVFERWDSYNKEKNKTLPFYFDKATIRGASISDKDLSGDIFFDNCDIIDDFEVKKTRINCIYLRDCNIQSLGISGNSTIENIILIGCTIDNIVIKDSKVPNITISNCDIKNIAIKDISENNNTKLKNCSVSGYLLVMIKASISGGDYSNANIYNIDDVYFSGSYMRGVRYSSNKSDKWKELKEKYTGIKFIISTISLIFFISPYLVKVIFFKLLNLFEESVGNGICGEKLINNYGKTIECKEYSIVEYLLGFKENKLIFYFTLILIFYNISRAYLTYKVNQLTNKEGLTGYYPKIHSLNMDLLKDFSNDYMHLVLLDKLMKVVFYIVLISIVYQAFNLLTSTVWIPFIS